jgi:hypothetical protein
MDETVKTVHNKVVKTESELEKERAAFEKEKSEFEAITKKIEKVNFSSLFQLWSNIRRRS